MSDGAFRFPTIGAAAEARAVLLAIDEFSLPLKKNLCCYLSKPKVHPEPVLTASADKRDAPDYLGTHFYGSVIQEDDRFRMWYYSVGLGDGPAELTQGPMCYAESDDGIHWTKPILGQVEWRGSKENNAFLLPDWPVEGGNVIKDEDDPDPARRYKLAYNPQNDEHHWTIRMATSPDGIEWTAGSELPFDGFIEQSGFYKHNGLYFVNGQVRAVGEGGITAGRQGWVIVSSDFDHWLQESALSFALPEPHNLADRGMGGPFDQVHLGVGATSFGNVMVGLYGFWHNRETFGEISCDFGLVVSNDGFHFREPIKEHVYLSTEDSPVTPMEGMSYPTVLCQANGILNVGDETRIYHGRWRNAPYNHSNWNEQGYLAGGIHYYAEVALATLPRDRWGALGLYPNASEGTVWSAPVILPDGGCTLTLNADGVSEMRVEISDERFNLFPDYSGDNSGRSTAADGLDCPIAWSQGSLATLAGRSVRFRIHLKKMASTDPRLYAAYLTA